MLASIILVCGRDPVSGQVDGAHRVAASLLNAADYEVAGWALVPDERPLIEAAIKRHVRDLDCRMILILDVGFEHVQLNTAHAACEVCDHMLCVHARAACGLLNASVVVALPGRTGAVLGGLTSMLPTIERIRADGIA